MTRLLFFCEGPRADPATVHRATFVASKLESWDVSVLYGARVRIFSRWINLPRLRSYGRALRGSVMADILYILRTSNVLSYGLAGYYKRKGKKVVFDFDDSIYLKTHPLNSHLSHILRTSDGVVVGSHHLADYASRFNGHVGIFVSPVDTELFKPLDSRKNGVLTIGWLGTPGPLHLKSLKTVLDPLAEVAQRYDIRLKFVSSLGSRQLSELFHHLESLIEVDYGPKSWTPIERIPELISDFDISIMPLTDDDWSRGKGGTKILESMAMGIPIVASAVGENNHLVRDGENGFLAWNKDDWENKLAALIEDPLLRSRVGTSAREFVEEYHSLDRYVERLTHFLEGI